MSLLPMNEITSLEQLDLNKSYSYSDYLLWKFKDRVEIIKEKIMEISPAPTRFHQRISMKLTAHFLNFFDNHCCQLYEPSLMFVFLMKTAKLKLLYSQISV